jgi:hypothetical protein
MRDMTVTVSSRKIGIGLKELGFKYDWIIFGTTLEKLRRIDPVRVWRS